jgi:hypothetical protein
MIEALRAAVPRPELADRLALFGRFVGSWDVERTGHAADGTSVTVPGEWHWGWVLDGRAIQDVFICPARPLRTEPMPRPANGAPQIGCRRPPAGGTLTECERWSDVRSPRPTSVDPAGPGSSPTWAPATARPSSPGPPARRPRWSSASTPTLPRWPTPRAGPPGRR